MRVKNHAHTGPAEWVRLRRKEAEIDAIKVARAVRATSFGHPEDLLRIGNVLYIALQYEPKTAGSKGPGAIMALPLGAKPKIRYFVKVGENVPAENKANGVTGLFQPADLVLGTRWKIVDRRGQPTERHLGSIDTNGIRMA